ncbi:MAG: glycosyltransferase family 87 protein [Sandaracinus sp.]
MQRLLGLLSGHIAARLLALFAFLVLATYLGLLLVDDVRAGDRLFLRDYYCFYRAGELVLSGGTGYEDEYRTFANPPFTLPVVAAIALAGPDGSYWVCLGLGTILTVLGMLALAQIPGVDRRYRLTMILAALASPSLTFALHHGQATPVYLFLSAIVIYGWCAERDVVAGIAAGLLCAKPPLAIAVLAIGTVSRPRAFTIAWVSTLAALLAVSAPFGLESWRGFRGAVDTLVERHETATNSWRIQLTFYAFVRMLIWKIMGSPEDALRGREIARGLALVTSAAAGAWGLALRVRARADWHLPTHRVERMVRLGSMAMLATIALNLYLFYYDSALALIPTMFLFTHESAWRSRARWWLALVLAMAIWIAQVLPMLWNDGPNPIGLLALVWLGLELTELGAIPASSQAARDAPPTALAPHEAS